MPWRTSLDVLQVTLALNLVVSSQLPRRRNIGTVCRKGPVVEAFPNAFLGVLMPEVELLAAPKFKRGRHFDWLYDQMFTTGRLESLLSRRLDLPGVVCRSLS
jgi:hypothetical protein